MLRFRVWRAAILLALAVGLGSAPALAAEDIVIGAIYPLTGNSAPIGADAKIALDVISEIINGTHAPIPMLLGKGGGLDKLGGAKIRIIIADHQNDPQKARAEAERLITQEHVVALIGSYTSATAATMWPSAGTSPSRPGSPRSRSARSMRGTRRATMPGSRSASRTRCWTRRWPGWPGISRPNRAKC